MGCQSLLLQLEDKLLRGKQFTSASARAFVLHHGGLDRGVEHARARQNRHVAHSTVTDNGLCLHHTFGSVLGCLAWHFR